MIIIQTTIYGKHNLKDTNMLKNIYLEGVKRVKLHRGKYYDICYSVNAGYYSVESPVQYDISKDNDYTVVTV